MSLLTAEKVESVFMDCLFREGEDTSNPAVANVVSANIGFNRERLEGHRSIIGEMLGELPDAFHTNRGGGMSFLNACVTRHGDQWGEHSNVDQLLALGIATNQARMLFARSLWDAFPGGMPYFSVL